MSAEEVPAEEVVEEVEEEEVVEEEINLSVGDALKEVSRFCFMQMFKHELIFTFMIQS
jgi:hypothetical protein